MTTRYEVVGAVDRSTADVLETAADVILVDDGNEDLLIAQRTEREDDD
ncbi:hypothetical protein HTZ84_05390 [Haloterrigena sp. SYSU A558-1]|uniref:Uncharacterized protein n=1 Tax=Haloterrigena gelatinilytica TaxID=2741724 RepID=A0ABX2LBM7_9EURY|nr:hypothetical protein [Haloterrigena gelatinilytica]NUC71748.1 hypothetical protein [Haloterrigena gelatinilytica]